MPWRAGLAWKAGVYLGWSVFAAGGAVMAQATTATQNNAGIGIAVIGLLTLLIQYFYKDRSEARAMRVKELTEKNAEMEARVKELEHLPTQVAENTARTLASEGRLDGLVANLQQLGYFSPSTSDLAVYDPSQPARSPRTTVLVVEDNPQTVRLLCELFTARGYAATPAVTIPEAMDKLDKYPHWVVLDLRVGDGDGMDILRRVRSEKLPVRVAVVTGTPDPRRLEEAGKLADVVFEKPISGANFDRLLRVMSEVPKPPRPAPPPAPGPPGAP